MNSDPNSAPRYASARDTAPQGFDQLGWPLPEVRSMMVDNFVRSWFKHWIGAIIIFVLSVVVVLGATILSTPVWEGTATVLISQTDLPRLTIASGGTVETSPVQTGMLARNLTELVHDHSLQYEVIDETHLDTYLVERSKKWRERIKERIKYVLMLKFIFGKKDDWRVKAKKELDKSWLSIAPAEGTSKLPLYVYGSDPKMTVEVGNKILEKVQEYMDRSLRSAIQNELTTVSKIIEQKQADLAAVEARMTEFRQSIGYINPLSYANSVQDDLNTLDQQVNIIAAEKSGLDQSIRQTEDELKQYEPFIDLTREGTQIKPNDLASQRIQRDLTELRSQRSGLLVSMKSGSAEVRTLDGQISEMEKELKSALANEKSKEQTSSLITRDWDPRYQNLFNRWLDARSQQALVEARMKGTQDAIVKMQQKQREAIAADTTLRQMNRQLQLKLDDLNNMTSKKQSFETQLAQEHIFNAMQVVKKMSVNTPAQPDRPNKLLAVILAIAIGLFMALVLPVALDYLNQTLLSSRQASTIPGIRLAAVVPKMSLRKMTKSISV